MRKVGVLTDPVKSGKSTVACPHCGAPTSVTSSGKCEYCGFIITTGNLIGYFLTLKPLSQIQTLVTVA